MKTADILLVKINGSTTAQYIATTTTKAEAIFNQLAEGMLKEDYKEVRSLDYGKTLTDVNKWLRDNNTGKRIEWFEGIEIN